jgi:hypothetical protein
LPSFLFTTTTTDTDHGFGSDALSLVLFLLGLQWTVDYGRPNSLVISPSGACLPIFFAPYVLDV